MRLYLTSLLLILIIVAKAQPNASVFYSSDETCATGNGFIQISVSGGLPPYSFIWSNGATTQDVYGLGSGTYTVTVTDVNGATGILSIPIGNVNSLTGVDMTFFIPGQVPYNTWPCNSNCNGIAYLDETFINGTPPYSIAIQSSNNPQLALTSYNGIPAVANVCNNSVYTLIVTDATGCSATSVNSVPTPLRSFAHYPVIKPSCFGLSNGEVAFNFTNLFYPSNSTGSYPLLNIYEPQLGTIPVYSSDATISNLAPGTYDFTVSYELVGNCDTIIHIVIPDLGSTCGTISGSVILDTITNCQLDAGEPLLPQQLIRFNPGPFYTFSDSAGNFSIQLPNGSYSATILSIPPFYPSCSQANLNLSAINPAIANILLADSLDPVPNMNVHITSTSFRPGFVGLLYVNVKNLSLPQITNPEIDIFFDPVLTYFYSPLTPLINTPGHLKFSLDTLHFSGETILPVMFGLPSNPSLLGVPISFTVNANSNLSEPDLTDNADSLTTVIVGSFDPNDKTVFPSRDSLNSFLTNLDTDIRFQIRFQNTGTDTAFNIVVVDTLSSSLDPSTFKLIATSHPVQLEFSGSNVLKFKFNNILLPDSNTNEPASHGVIYFSIEPFKPVTVPTIENKAEIYFDFNPPVITNTVVSTISSTVGIASISRNSQLKLVPNPASTTVTLDFQQIRDAVEFSVYDMMGKSLYTASISAGTTQYNLDINAINNGFYIVKVIGASGNVSSAGLMINH